MKQHILRLLIVLILLVGIGAGIYFLFIKERDYLASTVIKNELAKTEELQKLLFGEDGKNIGWTASGEYTNQKIIYQEFTNNLQEYSVILLNTKIPSEFASTLKNNFKEFQKNVDKLVDSGKILRKYLLLSSQDATEKEGRYNIVVADIKQVNKSFYKIVSTFDRVVESCVYQGRNSTILGSLTSCENILWNAYLTSDNNFNLSYQTSTKVNDLRNNLGKVKDNMTTFMVRFNARTLNEWESDFTNCFTEVTDFSAVDPFYTTKYANIFGIINYLTQEEYYEQV